MSDKSMSDNPTLPGIGKNVFLLSSVLYRFSYKYGYSTWQPASLDRGNPAFPLSLTLLLATFSLLSSSACLRL